MASERLLSSALMLDQVAWSSCDDLMASASLKAQLGQRVLKGENLKGPKFFQIVATRLPLERVLNFLLDEAILVEINKGLAFLEDFLEALLEILG